MLIAIYNKLSRNGKAKEQEIRSRALSFANYLILNKEEAKINPSAVIGKALQDSTAFSPSRVSIENCNTPPNCGGPGTGECNIVQVGTMLVCIGAVTVGQVQVCVAFAIIGIFACIF